MKDAVNQYVEELTPSQLKKVKLLLESLERDYGFYLVPNNYGFYLSPNQVTRDRWDFQAGFIIIVDYNDLSIRYINHPDRLIPTRNMVFTTLHPIDFLTRVTLNRVNREYLIFEELIE